MKYCLIILFTLNSIFLSAQVKVGVEATGKHGRAISTYKKVKEEAKQRMEQLKLIENYQKAQAHFKSEYEKQKAEKLHDIYDDSLKLAEWTKEDSIQLSRMIMEDINFPQNYLELIMNPLSIDSLLLSSVDSSAFSPETLIGEHLKEFLPYELRQQENIFQNGDPSGLLASTTPELNDLNLSKPNPNLIKPDEARKLLGNVDPEQLSKVQANVTALKKKYSEIPDVRFPEAGRKRNSLEDIPFNKRLYFGGNFSLKSTDPPIVDANLQWGYQFNKKWMSGLGIILREQFNSESAVSITGDAYGYSFFTKYDVLKQVYAWAEFDRQVNKSIFNNEADVSTQWQEAYLIGIGKEFRLGFLQMTSLLLYDFNHRNNELNARPFVFRLGMWLGTDQ